MDAPGISRRRGRGRDAFAGIGPPLRELFGRKPISAAADAAAVAPALPTSRGKRERGLSRERGKKKKPFPFFSSSLPVALLFLSGVFTLSLSRLLGSNGVKVFAFSPQLCFIFFSLCFV